MSGTFPADVRAHTAVAGDVDGERRRILLPKWGSSIVHSAQPGRELYSEPRLILLSSGGRIIRRGQQFPMKR